MAGGITDVAGIQTPSSVIGKIETSIPDSHKPGEPIRKEIGGIFAGVQGIIKKNPVLALGVVILVVGGIITYLTMRGGSKKKTKGYAKKGAKKLIGR